MSPDGAPRCRVCDVMGSVHRGGCGAILPNRGLRTAGEQLAATYRSNRTAGVELTTLASDKVQRLGNWPRSPSRARS